MTNEPSGRERDAVGLRFAESREKLLFCLLTQNSNWESFGGRKVSLIIYWSKLPSNSGRVLKSMKKREEDGGAL